MLFLGVAFLAQFPRLSTFRLHLVEYLPSSFGLVHGQLCSFCDAPVDLKLHSTLCSLRLLRRKCVCLDSLVAKALLELPGPLPVLPHEKILVAVLPSSAAVLPSSDAFQEFLNDRFLVFDTFHLLEDSQSPLPWIVPVGWERSMDWKLDSSPLWFLKSRLAGALATAFDECLRSFDGYLTDAGLCRFCSLRLDLLTPAALCRFRQLKGICGCEDTTNAVYLFQCTPVFVQMLHLIPHMHGAGHERLQELLQRLLKCKLSACRLTSLEEEELRTRGMTLKVLSSPLQKLIWEYIMVPGAIGPSSDLQAFDLELCDVVEAAYCHVRGSASSDFYDTLWAAEDAAKTADWSVSGCPLEDERRISQAADQRRLTFLQSQDPNLKICCCCVSFLPLLSFPKRFRSKPSCFQANGDMCTACGKARWFVRGSPAESRIA